MNPLDWLSPTRWLMVAAALLAALGAFKVWEVRTERVGYAKAEAYYTAVLARQSAAASAALTVERAKTDAARQELDAFRVQQEVKDEHNARTMAALGDRLRGLLNGAGQLRDPHAGACADSIGVPAPVETAAAANGGADNGTQTGGLLSAPLSGLLRELTAEADSINTAYISCRADALAQRTQEH